MSSSARRALRLAAGLAFVAAVSFAAPMTADAGTPPEGSPCDSAHTSPSDWYFGYKFEIRSLYSGTTYCIPGHHLSMQSDGNLVLYNDYGPIWASGTWGHPGAYADMQDDGNLVVYGPGRSALWSSGTWGHTEPEGMYLDLQPDGNLVIYGNGHNPYWSSQTWGR
jgi:hypothetical protein